MKNHGDFDEFSHTCHTNHGAIGAAHHPPLCPGFHLEAAGSGSDFGGDVQPGPPLSPETSEVHGAGYDHRLVTMETS